MFESTKRNWFLVIILVLFIVFAVLRSVDLKLTQDIQKQLRNWMESDSKEHHKTQIDWNSISADEMTAEQMFQYLHWTNSEACKVHYDFGGIVLNYFNFHAIDGQKVVCMDEGVKPAVKCLVYSFGINNEWSFDKVFESFGCDIYAFDPSMTMNDADYTPKIHFSKVGLSYEDTDKGPNGWKMRTLDSLYKILERKHGQNAVIDYLKIDIEGSEWAALKQMLSTNILKKVKQIGMEIHFNEKTEQDFRTGIRILKQLEASGWMRFTSRVNVYMNSTIAFLGRTEYFGYEVTWYNGAFKA